MGASRNDDLGVVPEGRENRRRSPVPARSSDLIFPLLPEIIGTSDPVIIDVGANMGQFASRVARRSRPGRYIVSSRCASTRLDCTVCFAG